LWSEALKTEMPQSDRPRGKKGKGPILACLVSALLIAGVRPAWAEPPTACQSLVTLVAAAPAGPVFLASYPTVTEGPMHGAAFLYDNAAATIALVGCGQVAEARRIGDAILLALNNDRFWHDGRLRNGYAAGAVGQGPIKLSGWWDTGQQRWFEDRYQVGSDNGNMAWAILALLALDRAGAGPDYRTGAERIGHWVAALRDPRGPGGFSGGVFGHEPAPSPLTWKSTEHNTDLAATFTRLAQITGKPFWSEQAAAATHFVEAMWDPASARFAVGTGEDGVTHNPLLALDAQIWPLLALHGAATRHAPVVATIEQQLKVDDGYAYSQAKDGIWTEGTAQMALLDALTGHEAEAKATLAAIRPQQTPDGSYYASNTQALPTGFMLQTDPMKPRLYFRLPHLGATAWVALAERQFNPFTATTELP
jgi:hypothetical protein